MRKAGIEFLRGDASDEKTLLRAGADKARFIIVSLPHAEEVVKVIEHVGKDIPVFSRIFEESAARLIADKGGVPILNSLAAADQFMEWFAMREEMRLAADPGPTA